MDGIGHVGLGTLAGDEILLGAGLAGHLVNEGDGLGLGSEEVIIVLSGNQLQKLPGAGNRQLCVAKADKGADVQIVRDLADGQLTLEARNLHRIGHRNIPPNKIPGFPDQFPRILYNVRRKSQGAGLHLRAKTLPPGETDGRVHN